jgi:arylsulfatase A-like enzyme
MQRQVFILAALILGASPEAQAQRPPNVVLVMMDDVGYGDLSSYGALDVRTPNIDRLAREGVRLTDAYANGPACTPTRAALISGRYQQRVGLEGQLTLSPADRELGLPAPGTSLPALLKTSGYATGLVGKWHLGWKPEFGPIAHGFDSFYGFLSGAHSYYTNQAEIFRVGGGPPDLFENTTPVEATGYLTDEVTRRAVSFITRHADRPFFLEVAYNAAHWPFEPPDRPPTDAARGAARSLRQMPDDPVPASRQDYVRMLERADNGAITMDITASILAATDTRPPAGYRPDGIDILPILRGKAPLLERRLFWRWARPDRQQRAVRFGQWKLLIDASQLLLFALSVDPGERTDLAAQRPDLVTTLKRLLADWEGDVDQGGRGQ